MPQDEDLLTESFSARRKCFTVFQRITVVSNIIFALFALLLIVLGGVAVKALKTYSYLAQVSVPAGLIVLGVLLLFIIFLGIYGSFKKSTKFLGAYFILLFILIICEFGVGGGSYAYRSKIPGELEYSWPKISDQDRSALQYSFWCCGWSNVGDLPGSNCPNITIPSNSSISNSTTGTTGTTGMMVSRDVQSILQQAGSPPVNSTTSCQDLMISYFDSQLYAAGTVGVVFATLQLLSLLSSIIVFAFIKVEQRRSQDERF